MGVISGAIFWGASRDVLEEREGNGAFDFFLSFHNYLDVCTTLCHSSRQRECVFLAVVLVIRVDSLKSV